MKKILLFAATLVVAMSLNAQHVTPLKVKMVEVRLDSLRALYTDKSEYLVQLQHLELDMNGNAESLKQAHRQLDDEKAYSKCIADYVKYATKVLKTYEKGCKDNINDLRDMQKTIDNQTAVSKGLSLVTHDSRPKFIEHMANERKETEIEVGRMEKMIKTLEKQLARINVITEGLNLYNTEIQNKSNDLALKDNQFKLNMDALKQEMKNVKAEIKAASK